MSHRKYIVHLYTVRTRKKYCEREFLKIRISTRYFIIKVKKKKNYKYKPWPKACMELSRTNSLYVETVLIQSWSCLVIEERFLVFFPPKSSCAQRALDGHSSSFLSKFNWKCIFEIRGGGSSRSTCFPIKIISNRWSFEYCVFNWN